jgi:hypothetical protein
MAGVLGVDPSTLLRTAFGGNDDHARQFWRDVNQRQMNINQFVALQIPSAPKSPMSARTPTSGRRSRVRPVYTSSATNMARTRHAWPSDDGKVHYKVDFQQQQCQAYRIVRGSDVDASRATVIVVLQGSGAANPFRAFASPGRDQGRGLGRG